MNTKWRTAATAGALVVLTAGTAAADDASGWERVAAPESGIEYVLDDVTATASGTAYAVGFGEVGGGVVVARWTGSAWAWESGLPATSFSALRGVHARGDRVFAAGHDYVNGVSKPLLMVRAGGWTKAIGAVPSGDDGQLSDVVAVSDTTAWAVGREGSGLEARPVAHRWNGSALQRFALPAAGTYARAEAVAGSAEIWAVGTDGGLAGAPSRGLSWRWNGAGWNGVPVPTFGANQVELTDVVVTDRQVWAVGRADAQPLVLRWNGLAWERVALPVTAAPTRVNAAADDGRGGLWLAGEVRAGQDATPLLARYDGSWRTATVSAELANTALRGIAQVPGTTTAWAVGRHFRSGTYCSGCRASIATNG
ncbi:hypothetical protein [Saccharothrix variisporea]|uniref:Uncharacterized protein n=1 Tax=Saccharothrix variisporea TaxID=543527 RepID=A0A495XLM6_9PSEU|nr:hypothetical protein [Saccharothrix variisporea]RKT75017.1 hypothetical protein DFJ66_8393 [Saccharothrix variisporea]